MNSFLSSKDLTLFSNRNVGDLSQKLLVHTANASQIYWFFLLLIRDSLISIFIYSLLLIVSFKNTIFLTIFFLFIIVITFLLAKFIVIKFTNSRNKFQSQLFSLSNTVLSSLKIIKIFKKENLFQKKFNEQSFGFKSSEILLQTITNLPSILIRSVSYFSIIIIIFIFIHKYNSDGDISLLAIYIVGAYKLLNAFGSINNYLLSISSVYPSLKIIRNEIKNINIKKDLNIDDSSNKLKSIFDFKNELEFKKINYSYQDKKILSNLEIKIRKGSLNAIIGSSGAGKSTLLDILSGFKIPKKFEIMKDGIQVFNPKYENLSYCSQEAFIFNGSVEENITFFQKKDKINYVKLKEVFDLCLLDNFIKIKDIILEKGENLSFGQKQRINLARSLYQDYEIIFLDEPLSNVELSLENLVLNKIFRVIKRDNKTLVLVSHSSSTLEIFDQIVVIEKGTSSNYSSYDETMSKNKYFRDNFKEN